MTDLAGNSWNSSFSSDSMPHPWREQLLLYLDGELTESEREAIKTHLETCWKCRAHVAEIESTITSFSHFDDDVLAAHLPSPPNGWRGFGGQLQQMSSANGTPSWRTRWRNWWTGARGSSLQLRWLQPRWVTVVMLIVGLTAMSFWLVRSTPVSARELLQRSIQAETESLRKVAEPVLYRKLQVRRKTAQATDAVTWESWHAAHGDQFRQRVADQQGIRFLRANDNAAPPLLTAIEQILVLNHLDAQRPLSAVAFDGWRARVRGVIETVSNNDEQLMLTVQTPAPYTLHAIRQASLLVRRTDWHVVALHLQVQGEAEVQFYELSEAAYEVMPLDALTVFANLSLPSPSTVPTNSPVAPTASPVRVAAVPSPSLAVVAPLPSTAALQEAEVATLYALHQLRADLGEQIEVTRDNGRQIVVRGLVQTATRKAELLQSLNPIALVRPQIQTIEEAVQQAQQTAPPATSNDAVVTTIDVAVTSSETVAKVNPFQQKLAEYFGGRKGLSDTEREVVNRKITQFYNAIETDASAATAEAWALRRLQDRLTTMAESGVELAPASKQQLDEMLKTHIVRLRQRAQSLQARLRPLLAALGIEPGNVGPLNTSNRAAKIQMVFQAVAQISRLSDTLIGGKSADPLPTTAKSLLTELARLEAALKTLEEV